MVLIAGFALARRDRSIGWPVAALGALIACLTPALSGHAAAADPSALVIAADVAHVLAAGGWLGALALVMLAGMPATLRLDDGERGRAALALVNAFSPVALSLGALIAISGVTMAWVHLGSLQALVATGYGRTLLIKLVLLLPLGAIAAYNWRRVRPRVATAGGTRALQRSAAAELAVAGVVLAVTAVLVAMPIE
jgi:copper transport protein